MYKVLEHTADLRLKVRANTLQNLFAEALRGMMHVLKTKYGRARPGALSRLVSISAKNSTPLLVDFLSEVLTLCHINKEVYPQVVFRKFSPVKLEAELYGVGVDSFDEDIKAVTYHQAQVRQNEKGEWETILVFDV